MNTLLDILKIAFIVLLCIILVPMALVAVISVITWILGFSTNGILVLILIALVIYIFK